MSAGRIDPSGLPHSLSVSPTKHPAGLNEAQQGHIHSPSPLIARARRSRGLQSSILDTAQGLALVVVLVADHSHLLSTAARTTKKPRPLGRPGAELCGRKLGVSFAPRT